MSQAPARKQAATAALGRLIFALLTAAIVIVFSEKMYWYVTGYDIVWPIAGYLLPSFAFLALVDVFRIRRLAPLFLAAACFGFLVEGVLVPIIYEGGPFAWFNVSYTPLAWHAPLSIVFGWYYLRRWLVEGRRRLLVLGSAAVGLFWGVWALAWWLPENLADPELLAQGARLGAWPIADFALHAFLFAGLVILSHWLLGWRGWRPAFRPSRVELVILVAGLLFFFIFQVLLTTWWAPFKLVPLLLAALIPLAIQRRQQPEGSLLADLAGPVRPADALLILVMPAVAVAVYALATAVQPPVDLIYLATAIVQVLGSAYAGAIAFVAAIILTIWPPKRRSSSLPVAGPL